MSIKTKLTLTIAVLVAMIVIVVAVAVTNLQILTATEPDSPAAGPGLSRAIVWIVVTGGICILISLGIIIRIPNSINKPIKQLTDGIKEIANHNYDVKIDLRGGEELETVSGNFNRMAKRLQDYHSSSVSDLMSSKRYLETIINSISEPIIGMDNDMKVLFVNDEALNVLNLKREDVIQKSAQEVAVRNDLLRRLIREMFDGKSGEQEQDKSKREALKIYADNKESYFQVKYMDITMTGKDGKTKERRGDVIMLRNITEFQELDTAKTTFISTISHELKTPISAILMSQQLLDDKRVGSLNPEQEELSRSIRENSERLLSITGELLNMTQIESGKLLLKPKMTEPIELIRYAIKANHVQAEKFGIEIEVDYPKDNKISGLFVDSEKIAWVLTNLLSNAIRYSPESGRVIVGARQPDTKHVELYVRDFGKGIDPRYHESIFEHYFRVPGTKVQGSGLGLAISRDFMEAHGGTLTVDSELGKVSVFVMRFNV